MELIPLFSGSSGNCTLIRADKANILIDAGQNCKKIVEALNHVGTRPEDIDAVFITHSHVDHVSGLDVFIRKYPSKLYATEGTFNGISRRFKKPHTLTPDIVVIPGQVFEVLPGVTSVACQTPHDAYGSCCYKIFCENKSCMVMTDLGYFTEDIKNLAMGSDAILVESNYDSRMLVYGPYPEELKARIAGNYGHMSNDDCAKAMEYLIANGTHKFILGHLSAENNRPDIAEKSVRDYLSSSILIKDQDYEFYTANRYEPTKGVII